MRTKTTVGLTMLATVAATALGALPSSAAGGSLDYEHPSRSWWGTNGRVTNAVAVGDRVYLAGGFDYIGPQTGYGVPVSGDSGRMQANAPVINGRVDVAVPDGHGGWFVGGNFSKVGERWRRNAAHIDASGKVLRWNPRPKGEVFAIAVLGDKVVLGGSFTVLGTDKASVSRIGAVDLQVGSTLPGWSASANGTVRQLLPSAHGLYAAGDFTAVDGASASRLARLSTATGALEGAFTGRTNGRVSTLALSPDGSRLYAGGDFSTAVGGGHALARARLAAFSTSTGAVLPWAPAANASVQALAVDPDSGTVYAGGTFTSLGGVTRATLAAIDTGGSVASFDANINGCHIAHYLGHRNNNPTCSPQVDALSVSGGVLYVGGRFGAAGDVVRHDAAAFALGSSTPNEWNPVASDQVLTVASADGRVFVGGNITSVNGLVRKGLAALDASTGAGDPAFRADTSNLPLDLEASPDGSRLYVVGNFKTVQGVPRTNIAAIDTATGRVDTSFKANTNPAGYGLVAKYGGGKLYVGGKFKKVNGVARGHMVRLDPVTGAVDPGFVADTWGPKGKSYRDGMVQGLAVRKDGSRVFIGGAITSLNGKPVKGIAVVDSTGKLLANQLGGLSGCGTRIIPSAPYLVLSDDGKRLYGGDECPDYVYQWDAVNLSSSAKPTGLNWRSWCDGGMQAALEVNGRFYYGTHGKVCDTSPTNTTHQKRTRFAVFDATTGALLPDAPAFGSPMGVESLTVLPQGLLVGGDFTFAGSFRGVNQGLALFPGTP